MKALFFLIALANIVLLMWEYRNGAFFKPVQPLSFNGGEPILLVRELPGPTSSPILPAKEPQAPLSNAP